MRLRKYIKIMRKYKYGLITRERVRKYLNEKIQCGGKMHKKRIK